MECYPARSRRAGPLGPIVTEYDYDGRGNLTQATYAAGVEGYEAVETWAYDATWNAVNRHVDTLGRVTTYEIDHDTGLVTSITRVVGDEGGSDDLTTSYTYTDGMGQYAALPVGLLLTETDPLGQVTQYAYGTTAGGSFGKVTSVTYALGTADEATVQYEYDSRGNRTATIDELGRRTEYEYDSLDRMVSMTEPDPDGGGPLGTSITTYQYDGLGHLTHTIDPQGNDTETVYCPLGIRATKSIGPDPDGSGPGNPLTAPVTVYGYDAGLRLVSVTDALGRVTQSGYDDLGRRTDTYSGAILDGAEGYEETLGTWSDLETGYGDGSRSHATDTSPTATATWTFDNLPAGQYDVFAIWTADAQNANNAPFTVSHDEYSESTVTLDQSQAPEVGAGQDDAVLIGNVWWRKIGSYTITGDSLSVELGNNAQAGKRVVADAVYVVSHDPTSHIDYYEGSNNVWKTTDAAGSVTEYVYDARGRVADVLSPGDVVTHYVCDAASQVRWTKIYASDDFTLDADELRAETQYLYDDLGRVYELRVYEVDPTTGEVRDYLATKTWYDADGQVVKTRTGEGAFQKYAYDARGPAWWPPSSPSTPTKSTPTMPRCRTSWATR